MSAYNVERFWRFSSELAKIIPGFEIKFKNESSFMKFLGKILFFNPGFMTSYTTTLGKTIYFPKADDLAENSSLVVLGHEFRHIWDNKKLSFLFFVIYILPQILALLSLILIPFIWWLALILFVVFLAPLPAPGRMWAELKGYQMSLYMHNLLMQEWGFDDERRRNKLISHAEYYNHAFTGPGYYFMWPFGVKKQFLSTIDKIMNNSFDQENEIYPLMKKAFEQSK